MEVYDSSAFFNHFNPSTKFNKWVAVAAADFNIVPTGIEMIIMPVGLYAGFAHRGRASDAPTTYLYILEKWLPTADIILDNRPHFALMGEKYTPNVPNAEEEIWIPIKPR